MNKRILHQLMQLRSETANKKLAEIADQFVEGIKRSKENDEIFEKLDLLAEFVYAVPDQALAVANFIINNKNPNKPKEKTSKYLKGLTGSSHDRLVIKSLELLDKIRYLRTKEVLEMVVDIDSKDSHVIKKREELLNSISKYDYHVLNQIGLAVQKVVLQYMEENMKKLRLDDLLVFSKQMLDPDFEGTELIEENKISLITGALSADEHTKQVRLKTLDILFQKLKEVQDTEQKLSILQVIEGAVRFPTRDYKDDFLKMVDENARYIIEKYESLVLKNGKVVEDFRVVSKVAEQLAWIRERLSKEKVTQKSASGLIAKINTDSDYSLYSDLIEDNSIFRTKLDEKKEKLKEKSNEFFKAFNDANWHDKLIKLNTIANYYNPNGNTWKWNSFIDLLVRIGQEKAEIADKMITEIVSQKMIMKNLVWAFMFGLRKSENFSILDRNVELLLQSKEQELIQAIPRSMMFLDKDKLTIQIRNKDIQLLKKLHTDKSTDQVTKNLIVNVSVTSYKRSLKDFKQIIIEGLKKSEAFDLYTSYVDFGLVRNELTFDDWTDSDFETILGRLVEEGNLDYDKMDIITKIAKINVKIVLDLFEARMKYKEESKSEAEGWSYYDAIPSYFDKELLEIFRNSKEYETRLRAWIKDIDTKFSSRNWRIAELTHNVGGEVFSKIINEMIESGDLKELNKIITLQEGAHTSDITLLIKVVEKTDNEKIRSRTISRLYSTGVVTGEYGIKNFYLRRVNELEKIQKENKNPNIQRLTKEAIESFKTSAEREDKRVKEELIRRKIEFEN